VAHACTAVEQILAQSPTPVLRKDADLFNVGVSIDDIDDDVADRSIDTRPRQPNSVHAA
jgi:hypothetical protein